MLFSDKEQEAQVRSLIAEAVHLARNTTPGNMSDEAIVQKVLKERFVDGEWRVGYHDQRLAKRLEDPEFRAEFEQAKRNLVER